MLNNPNDRYRAYRLLRKVPLKEIQSTLFEVLHEPSQAKILHIANDDQENVFCLSFQTTPETSNGVAHILEHTVLCGSEKFPVKDPFFAMIRRSLNTFMNAFTGADFTCYPAATQLEKDFYNLLDVYCDAVFKPKLDERSFRQEGHRLDFSIPGNISSPLQYKGIVFNEMKGALVSGEARLSDATQTALFPDLTYGINSGGEPKEIPHLTYEGLLAFHRKHYHPSRCLFYFYGNLPLKKHLDFLEEHVFKGIEPVEALPPLPRQKRQTEKVTQTIPFPFPAEEDPKNKGFMTVSWLTCHILEQEELLGLTILLILLMGTDAAPLKRALLRSGLCKNASAYLIDDFSEVPVVVTLKGCNTEDRQELEALIEKTLQNIVKEGFSEELIKNAMHQVEFHRCEITGDSIPYGLSLFMRSGLLYQHHGMPEDALKIHSLFDALRENLSANPDYFSSLIEKYFLNNPHKATVEAIPDRELEKKELEEESKKLQQIQKELSESEKLALVEKNRALEQFQKEQESADCSILPKLSLNDIPKEARDYPLIMHEQGSLKIYRHHCFTNDIVYADLTFPLPQLSQDDLPFVKLFTVLLPQIGCGGRSYEETLKFIQAHTGGVGATESLNIQATNFNAISPYLTIEGKALGRKREHLFMLLKEMSTSPNFKDRKRLQELLIKHFNTLHNSVNHNALKYAMNLAASGLSVPATIGNAWSGLTYYHTIKDLVENLDTKLDSLIEKLEAMKGLLLGLEDAHLVLSCDEQMGHKLSQERYFGLEDVITNKGSSWTNHYAVSPISHEGRVIASPVAFTASVMKSLPYIDPETPALNVAGQLFDNLVLHPRIREQGGAYGGGAMNTSLSGHFCFYAYRDPNISSSFNAFEEAVKRIGNGDFTAVDIEEAQMEIIQGYDSPVSPGSRAQVAYAWEREGKTLELRQRNRERLLALTKRQVIDAVNTHILPGYEERTTVVFAGQELLDRENTLLAEQGKKQLEIKSL